MQFTPSFRKTYFSTPGWSFSLRFLDEYFVLSFRFFLFHSTCMPVSVILIYFITIRYLNFCLTQFEVRTVNVTTAVRAVKIGTDISEEFAKLHCVTFKKTTLVIMRCSLHRFSICLQNTNSDTYNKSGTLHVSHPLVHGLSDSTRTGCRILGDLGFRCWCADWLSWLRGFVVLLSLYREETGVYT